MNNTVINHYYKVKINQITLFLIKIISKEKRILDLI